MWKHEQNMLHLCLSSHMRREKEKGWDPRFLVFPLYFSGPPNKRNVLSLTKLSLPKLSLLYFSQNKQSVSDQDLLYDSEVNQDLFKD
jgi:hypothetical protein